MPQEGLLVRKAHIDGAIQVVVPPSLRQRALVMSHYLSVAEQLVQRRMYSTLGQTFYLPTIVAGVDNFSHNSASGARKSSEYCHRRNVRLLRTSEPLELVAMYFDGSFPKPWQGNQYILLLQIATPS